MFNAQFNTCCANEDPLFIFFRYAPMDVIRKQMADSGFFVKCVLSHCQETHMIPELFLDPKGPLSQTWRNFDR